MRRVLRKLPWVALLGASWALAVYGASGAPAGSSLTMRLAGPLAGPLAAAQWVRVDLAMRAGRTDLALARAETAFALNPTSTSGWFFLSRHLAFDLSSPEREPDADARLRWVEAALAIAERGERTADDPAELAFWQGLVLARTAEVDPQLAWPGGVAGMWSAAVEHFARAARGGHPEAAAAAELARRARDSR